MWVGAFLMLASGGALVGGELLMSNLTSSVETDNLLGKARKSNSGRAVPEGPLNMLLVGSDFRKGVKETMWRADTVIVVHVPASRDRAYLISFPRDTLVKIPAHEPSGYQGGEDKINAAFGFGGRRQNSFDVASGFELLALTIHENFGIPLDTGAVINFYGFVNIVQELGGVEICIETPPGTDRFKSRHSERVFVKGCRMYDGHAALDYARQRYQFPDGDYARMRHQQHVIKQILKQAIAKGFDDPTKIPGLIKAAGNSLLLDSSIPIPDLALALRKIRPENLTALKVPTVSEKIDGTWYELLEEDKASALWKAIEEDNVDSWVLQNPDFVNPM